MSERSPASSPASPRSPEWLRGVQVAAWVLPGVVLIAAYTAIAIHAGDAWPWREIVHESGDRTLIATVLYYQHAARELPLDLVLALAVAGSALFALPSGNTAVSAPHRSLRRVWLGGAAVLVVAAIVAGTLAVGGVSSLGDNLLQMHTRPGEPLAWGAHWRYHLLSRAALLLVSLGFAAGLVRLVGGSAARGAVSGLALYGAALATFAGLSLVFAPDLDPFRDPVFLGHQIREVFTHALVTLPAAWALCLALAGPNAAPLRDAGVSLLWPAVAGGAGLFLGAFLLVAALGASAATQGQTDSLVLLLAPHFFEHSFSYLVVPLVAGFVYETAALARSRS